MKQKAIRWPRAILASVGSVMVFVITFIAAVNLSITFAMACGKIPLLRELTAAAALSPSLSAAIENEYVQLMDLEQTIGSVTMRIEYVIVDQKQLNIFYTLRSQNKIRLLFEPDFNLKDGANYLSYSHEYPEQGTLGKITVEFTDADMPAEWILDCPVYESDVDSSSPVSVIDLKRDLVARFHFELQFDPLLSERESGENA